jgi:hypothetical protein
MKLNLDDIHSEWETDCQIDGLRLDEESRRTPVLHAKYLQALSMSKIKLKDLENKHKVLMKDKFLYYGGKMDQQALEQKNWKDDPFDGLKIMKGDMDHFKGSDGDIQESESVILYYRTMIEHLKEICDSLKWRHQTIKNAIDWSKFQAGG